MNKLTLALLGGISILALAGCGKKKSGGDTSARMTEFKNAICACKPADSACANKVLDDQKKWADEMAKTVDKEAKPDPEAAKQLEPIMAEYQKCMTVALTPATPEQPAGSAEPKPAGAVMGALQKITPAVPKLAGADFEWKHEDGQSTTVMWRMRQKKSAGIGMLFELSDDTEKVTSKDFEPYTETDGKKYKGFPAKRGKDFLYVQVGKVGLNVSAGASFKQFANDAVMEEVLEGIDLQALAKL